MKALVKSADITVTDLTKIDPDLGRCGACASALGFGFAIAWKIQPIEDKSLGKICGFTSNDPDKIFVLEGPLGQMLGVSVHELSHILMHSDDSLPLALRELEAQMVVREILTGWGYWDSKVVIDWNEGVRWGIALNFDQESDRSSLGCDIGLGSILEDRLPLLIELSSTTQNRILVACGQITQMLASLPLQEVSSPKELDFI